MELLRGILTRRQVQDQTLPKHFQLSIILKSDQVFSKNIVPLDDFLFYHQEISGKPPNFTSQASRRSVIITSRQLDLWLAAGRSVYISSELKIFMKDLITTLRMDRRLTPGLSARVCRAFTAACQLAAMIFYQSEYLSEEHVEAVAINILCHHLRHRENENSMEQSRSILADVFCRISKPF